MFRLGLWLKMTFIAMSMVSWNGILVKRILHRKKEDIFGKDLHF